MQDADAAAPAVAQQIAALPPKSVGEIGDLVVPPEPKRKVTGTALHEGLVTTCRTWLCWNHMFCVLGCLCNVLHAAAVAACSNLSSA